jgi:hypothetical protein
MDGWMDGWMDEWMDGWTVTLCLLLVSLFSISLPVCRVALCQQLGNACICHKSVKSNAKSPPNT